MKDIPIVDCSTIHIDTTRLAKSCLASLDGIAGRYNHSSDCVFILSRERVTINNVVSVVSHEFLHKIIRHINGRNKSCMIDDYLKLTHSYYSGKIDYSGLNLKTRRLKNKRYVKKRSIWRRTFKKMW